MIRRIRSTPGGTDPYGDPTEGTDTTIVIDGAYVWPRESSELDGPGRAGVIVGLMLKVPYGTDVRHSDRFELADELAGMDGIYEVEGEPGPWKHPMTGWTPGTTVALRRVTG